MHPSDVLPNVAGETGRVVITSYRLTEEVAVDTIDGKTVTLGAGTVTVMQTLDGYQISDTDGNAVRVFRGAVDQLIARDLLK